MTCETASELREVIRGSAAAQYVDDHESVSSRSEIAVLFAKMEFAERSVGDGVAMKPQTRTPDAFRRRRKHTGSSRPATARCAGRAFSHPGPAGGRLWA